MSSLNCLFAFWVEESVLTYAKDVNFPLFCVRKEKARLGLQRETGRHGGVDVKVQILHGGHEKDNWR